MTLQGLPYATASEGMSFVTTLPDRVFSEVRIYRVACCGYGHIRSDLRPVTEINTILDFGKKVVIDPLNTIPVMYYT